MSKKEKNQITVTRKEAIELLTDLGFKDIGKADNVTMERRLGKMKLYLESFEGTMNGDMKALADNCIKAGKDSIKVTGEEPKAKAKGEKPMEDDDSREKTFDVDLKGWRYDKATLLDQLPILLKNEKGEAKKILDMLKDKGKLDEWADIVPEYEKQLREGKGFSSISVELTTVVDKKYAAYWRPALRTLVLILPKHNELRLVEPLIIDDDVDYKNLKLILD